MNEPAIRNPAASPVPARSAARRNPPGYAPSHHIRGRLATELTRFESRNGRNPKRSGRHPDRSTCPPESRFGDAVRTSGAPGPGLQCLVHHGSALAVERQCRAARCWPADPCHVGSIAVPALPVQRARRAARCCWSADPPRHRTSPPPGSWNCVLLWRPPWLGSPSRNPMHHLDAGSSIPISDRPKPSPARGENMTSPRNRQAGR